jgi:CRISPR/Cas system-associated exonuclease Cas4 (RecB family)
MKDFIDNLIKEFLGKRIRERKEGIIFPSEIGYCLRRLYYLYKKPKEISFETLKLFESGNIVHGWFVNVLYSSYQKDLIASFNYEQKLEYIENDLKICGRFDDIILIKIGEEKKLIEVKSAKGVDLIDKPKDHHYLQVNFYMKMLNMNKAYIVYISRTNLDMKVFEVSYSEEKFKELIKRAKFLNEHIKNNKLPFQEARLNNSAWQCRWCEYKNECDRDES